MRSFLVLLTSALAPHSALPDRDVATAAPEAPSTTRQKLRTHVRAGLGPENVQK